MDLATQNKTPSAEDNNQIEFSELWAMFKRRRFQFFVVAIVIFISGTVYAILAPAMYRSSATVLIAQQSIPKEFVRSTVTTFADQRIQNIRQRITSDKELEISIKKFNLYADLRKSQTSKEIIERMRSNIHIKMISANVIDATGRARKANIAFRIWFEYSKARRTQDVTVDLLNKFREINLRLRKSRTADTIDFLKVELQKYNDLVSEYDLKLSEFKKKNAGQLPGLFGVNTQILTKAEFDLHEVTGQISKTKQRRLLLQSKLSSTDPYHEESGKALSPRARLRTLKSKFVSMTASYASNHPDLIRTKREIEALKKEVGDWSEDLKELRRQLRAKRSSLVSTKKRYSANHPDVKKVKRDISRLKREIRKARKSAKRNSRRSKPANPIYIQLNSALKTIVIDLESYNRRKLELNEKIKSFQIKLAISPEIERQYKKLIRGYDNVLAKYKEFRSKLESAKVAASLEKGTQAERFETINFPAYPGKPFKPERVLIVLFSLVLALAVGVGLIFLLETLDGSIRGYKKVTNILGAPPLASIPLISNNYDNKPTKISNLNVLLIIIVLIGLALTVVHFLYEELDVLWFIMMRKLGV